MTDVRRLYWHSDRHGPVMVISLDRSAAEWLADHLPDYDLATKQLRRHLHELDEVPK